MSGTVVERPGPLSYKVKVDGGIVRRHIDQVRGDQRTRANESMAEKEFAPDALEDEVEQGLQEQAVPERMATPEPEAARSEQPHPEVATEPVMTPGSPDPVIAEPSRRYPQRDRRPPDRLGVGEC